MDKITKFLLRLSKKEREILLFLLERIKNLDLDWLDIKKLEWEKNMYRVRKWKIRIIFKKLWNTGLIIDMNYRSQIYKN